MVRLSEMRGKCEDGKVLWRYFLWGNFLCVRVTSGVGGGISVPAMGSLDTSQLAPTD